MNLKPARFTKSGEKQQTKRLYLHFYDHNEIRRRLPLFYDRKNSTEAGRAVERLVAIRASGDLIPPDLQRFIEFAKPSLRNRLAKWGIIDASRVAAVRPIANHLDDWKRFLESKGNDIDYVKLKVDRVTELFKACNFVLWNDIREEVVSETLGKWRVRAIERIGVTTSNHYLQAAKQFCIWMVRTAKRSTESPLSSLTPLSTSNNLLHDRRAFTVEEFNCLLTYLESAPSRMGIAAVERALLYRFAAGTGLRSTRISKLTRESFGEHRERHAVLIPAGRKNKERKAREVPLDESLWGMLEAHLVGKPLKAPVFTMPEKRHVAKMVKADVDAARAAWIGEASNDQERIDREASDFLRYKNDKNQHLDFHSFRHTRGVWLFEHHRAMPREVQELLGVGSLALVDRYSRSLTLTDLSVVDRGPKLGGTLELSGTAGPNSRAREGKILPRSLPQTGGLHRTQANSGGLDDPNDAETEEISNPQKTPENRRLLTQIFESDMVSPPNGAVAERLNAPVLKTGWPARVTRVRILPAPFFIFRTLQNPLRTVLCLRGKPVLGRRLRTLYSTPLVLHHLRLSGLSPSSLTA